MDDNQETIKKLRRFLDLAEVWKAEGWDQDTEDDMNEFWELQREFPQVFDLIK